MSNKIILATVAYVGLFAGASASAGILIDDFSNTQNVSQTVPGNNSDTFSGTLTGSDFASRELLVNLGAGAAATDEAAINVTGTSASIKVNVNDTGFARLQWADGGTPLNFTDGGGDTIEFSIPFIFGSNPEISMIVLDGTQNAEYVIPTGSALNPVAIEFEAVDWLDVTTGTVANVDWTHIIGFELSFTANSRAQSFTTLPLGAITVEDRVAGAVPVPASVLLMSLGLAGLGVVRLRRKA